MLSVLLGASAAVDRAGFASAAKGAATGLLYVANFAEAAHRLPAALSPLWSLSAEEQFYVVWPLVLILLGRRRRLVLVMLVAAIALVVAHRAQLAAAGHPWRRVETGPDTTPDALLVGCLLAVVRHNWGLPRLRKQVVAVAIAAGLALLVASPVKAAWAYEISVPVFSVCAAVLIAAAVEGWDAGLLQALGSRPLQWLGRVSYAAYLWNGIVLWATPVRGLAGLALTLVVAALSTRFVEQRFRRPRHEIRASPQPVPAAS
jgi:peptidoglycan/LPS O-acetylase OafA/YrhL